MHTPMDHKSFTAFTGSASTASRRRRSFSSSAATSAELSCLTQVTSAAAAATSSPAISFVREILRLAALFEQNKIGISPPFYFLLFGQNITIKKLHFYINGKIFMSPGLI